MEKHPKEVLSVLSASSVGLFALGGVNAGLGLPYFLGLGGVAAHYAW